jgi:DNA repair protein RadA/Sms
MAQRRIQQLALSSDQTCIHCGKKLPREKFKCTKCGGWTLPSALSRLGGVIDDGTILLHEVPDGEVKRLVTGPWDSNFGDPPGIPDDAVILVGGAPGAGKSTLALQWSDAIATASKMEVLYLCAEESKQQIKARNVRLGLVSKLVRIVPLERMGDASLDTILTNRKFSAVVLDSIAAFTNDPERAVEIVRAFKEFGNMYRMAFVVINHITKDGDMAGAMKLQHAGDISLMLTKGEKDEVEEVRFTGMEDEDDDDWFELKEVRELYTDKTRYGPSGVSTFYAMTGRGLVEVEFNDDDEGEE